MGRRIFLKWTAWIDAAITRRRRPFTSLLALTIVLGTLPGTASAQIQRAPQVPGPRTVPELRPIGPRPAGATLPVGTVPFLDTVMHLDVVGLSPDSQVTLGALQTDCFVLRPRVSYGPDTVGKDGHVQFTRLGWATRSGACHMSGRVSATGKTALDVHMDFGTVAVAEPTRYTLHDTWRLRDRLSFKLISGTGVCEGTAPGIPNSYHVGIRERDGNISLVIHGGPIGTDCQFSSRSWRLPAGVVVVSTTWDKSHQGSCGNVGPLGGGATNMLSTTTPNLNRGTAPIVINNVPESPTRYYSLLSADAQVVTSDNFILVEQNRTLASFLLPMWTRLQCSEALHNEDRIRLTLTEIVLSGPPGLSFP